jgi:hypothetical protein
MKKSVSTFIPRMHKNALRDLQIPLEAKTEVQRNVSQCIFCKIRTGPSRA